MPGHMDPRASPHSGCGLINILQEPMLAGAEYFTPHGMILIKHRNSCGRMDCVFAGLKLSLLDNGYEFEPCAVLISVPRAYAVRLRLFDDRSQHMLQQS